MSGAHTPGLDTRPHTIVSLNLAVSVIDSLEIETLRDGTTQTTIRADGHIVLTTNTGPNQAHASAQAMLEALERIDRSYDTVKTEVEEMGWNAAEIDVEALKAARQALKQARGDTEDVEDAARRQAEIAHADALQEHFELGKD